MKNLKQKLIRLGNTNPELRRHLTPILNKVSSEDSLAGGFKKMKKEWMADVHAKAVRKIQRLDEVINVEISRDQIIVSLMSGYVVEVMIQLMGFDQVGSGKISVWYDSDLTSHKDDYNTRVTKSSLSNIITREIKAIATM